MFEARITEGKIFKQIIDSIKDLVQDANMDCSNDGISIQSMDSSHVSLVSVHLNSNGLDHYRCDRAQNLGFNSANLSKILKCANNEDIITLKADDAADNLTLLFESPKNARIADFGTYIGQNSHGKIVQWPKYTTALLLCSFVRLTPLLQFEKNLN